MISTNELDFIKSRLPFWEHMTELQIRNLETNISKVTYHKGYNLHNSDHECLGVLFVKSGELRVYILSEDGREITLYRLLEGDICIMSASCILNSIHFDVHIDAECETEAFLLNISYFGKLCDQNVYAENFAYKSTVERFSDIMQAMEQILFLSFDKRLATFLLEEIDKNHSNEIHLTQEQIAKYIGSAREVVSRTLKIFQNRGMVTQSRGIIHVTDREQLEDLLL